MRKNKSKKFLALIFATITIFIIVGISVPALAANTSENISIFKYKASDLDFKKSISNYNSKSSITFNLCEDKKGNEYTYNKQGDLVGFKNNKVRNSNVSKLSKNTISEKSDEFLKSNKNIDLSAYTQKNIEYISNTNSYYITYYKLYNGYKTSDCMFLSYDEYGNLSSYAAPYLGSFKNIKIPSFKEKDYIVLLDKDLSITYNNIEYNYKINDKMLIIEEDQLKIQFYVTISFSDDTMTGLTFSYNI